MRVEKEPYKSGKTHVEKCHNSIDEELIIKVEEEDIFGEPAIDETVLYETEDSPNPIKLELVEVNSDYNDCLLYTSPSPRDS